MLIQLNIGEETVQIQIEEGADLNEVSQRFADQYNLTEDQLSVLREQIFTFYQQNF